MEIIQEYYPDLDVTDVKKLDDINGVPTEYNLYQNYPNPFNPATNINFAIPKASLVVIKVFDLLGREVETLVNEEKAAGSYNIQFNGSSFSNGIYFYRMQAGDFTQTNKMILLK